MKINNETGKASLNHELPAAGLHTWEKPEVKEWATPAVTEIEIAGGQTNFPTESGNYSPSGSLF